MTPEERKELLEEIKTANAGFNMDNPPEVKHFWVDRGLVMSCEGADHPNHRAFKRRK